MSEWPYNVARWARIRKQKLQRNPLCEACLQIGEIVPAEVVDHRVPISPQGRKERSASEAFPPLDRLASLCARCHNTKSRAEQLGQTDWMRAGCDVRGYPLDRNHPFYKERATRNDQK
jgi:5-methylcytosine-specific restriction endonuclease McrA